jgi:hypothetical protein
MKVYALYETYLAYPESWETLVDLYHNDKHAHDAKFALKIAADIAGDEHLSYDVRELTVK